MSSALSVPVFGVELQVQFVAELSDTAQHLAAECPLFSTLLLDPVLSLWSHWKETKSLGGKGGRFLLSGEMGASSAEPLLVIYASEALGDKWEQHPRERLRRLVSLGLSQIKESKALRGRICVDARSLGKSAEGWAEALEDIVQGISFPLYQFQSEFHFEADSKKETLGLKSLSLEVLVDRSGARNSEDSDLLGSLERSLQRAESFAFARHLGDVAPNLMWPERLAESIAERLKKVVSNVRILKEQELKEQGFGGIIAVGQGSTRKPALLIAEHAPAGATKTLVLVGKGVTFDTGGYSIKPKQFHNEMKYDMCGAANTAAAFEILARENLGVRVVCLLACAENLIGEEAQRPGDVYTAWNGKTVEVYNTDAEGRLMLADVLAFSKTFSPHVVVDMATLTGGTLSISGKLAGVGCCTSDGLWTEFKQQAQDSGERFTRLELIPGAVDEMKGFASDYTNMQSKWSSGAPTLYAASFLRDFVPEGCDWLHLDIANMAWGLSNAGLLSGVGANSFGARSLVSWAKCWAKS